MVEFSNPKLILLYKLTNAQGLMILSALADTASAPETGAWSFLCCILLPLSRRRQSSHSSTGRGQRSMPDVFFGCFSILFFQTGSSSEPGAHQLRDRAATEFHEFTPLCFSSTGVSGDCFMPGSLCRLWESELLPTCLYCRNFTTKPSAQALKRPFLNICCSWFG